MTASGDLATRGGDLRRRLRHQARILHVIAAAEYKLKYADSALGYVWSIAKPLAIFSVLYVVFGRFFKLNVNFPYYPVYLLIGIVLWTYFYDATTLSMASYVTRSSLLRKLAFPRLVIPVSVTLTAGITFLVNAGAVAVFVGVNGIVPRPDWLLLIPLVVELFAFTLAVSVVLALLFVRLRDVRQVWELGAQLLFYASPIIYPVKFLPVWAQKIAFVSPFVQVMQDIRRVLIGSTEYTAAEVYGSGWGRLIPLAFCAACLALAYWLYRREGPYLAERV
jgi:ABC-2 type transport system permease protein